MAGHFSRTRRTKVHSELPIFALCTRKVCHYYRLWKVGSATGASPLDLSCIKHLLHTVCVATFHWGMSRTAVLRHSNSTCATWSVINIVHPIERVVFYISTEKMSACNAALYCVHCWHRRNVPAGTAAVHCTICTQQKDPNRNGREIQQSAPVVSSTGVLCSCSSTITMLKSVHAPLLLYVKATAVVSVPNVTFLCRKFAVIRIFGTLMFHCGIAVRSSCRILKQSDILRHSKVLLWHVVHPWGAPSVQHVPQQR